MTKYTGKRVRHNMTLAERLKFYSIPEPNSGCTIWWGANKIGDGSHGMMWFAGEHRAAHVLSWELTNGRRVPDGLVVRHRCDFPPCINPDHLEIGTMGDNNRDRESRGRGRQPKGAASGRSKLSDEQVLAIRSDPRGKRPVAADYGVSAQLVKMIRQRKIWRHI